MSKRPSLRARASPAAVLVKRGHAPLAEFVQRVGLAAYGTGWLTAAKALTSSSLSESRAVGSDDELVWLVRDQVLLALQAGVITATVPLIVSRIPSPVRQPERVDEEDDEFLNDDLLLDDGDDGSHVEEDDGAPKLRFFKVNSAFWAAPFEHKNLDWNTSLVSIETKYLFEAVMASKQGMRTSSSHKHSRAKATESKNVPLSEKYVDPLRIFGVSIRILHPESALRSMFRYEELPDEAWFSRFAIYREKFNCELIAAAWRFITIAKPDNKHGVQTLLVGAMQDFMRTQGIDPDLGHGPKRAVLMEMAARIVAQWEQKNLSGSVLVSTNPKRPKI